MGSGRVGVGELVEGSSQFSISLEFQEAMCVWGVTPLFAAVFRKWILSTPMLQVVGVRCITQAWWGLSIGPFSESCFISTSVWKR